MNNQMGPPTSGGTVNGKTGPLRKQSLKWMEEVIIQLREKRFAGASTTVTVARSLEVFGGKRPTSS